MGREPSESDDAATPRASTLRNFSTARDSDLPQAYREQDGDRCVQEISGERRSTL
jgi:hypothetical protein